MASGPRAVAFLAGLNTGLYFAHRGLIYPVDAVTLAGGLWTDRRVFPGDIRWGQQILDQIEASIRAQTETPK